MTLGLGRASEGRQIHRAKVLSRITQHISCRRRLLAVETDIRNLAVVLTRTAAMLLLAGLLILVLLPAVLAASSR